MADAYTKKSRISARYISYSDIQFFRECIPLMRSCEKQPYISTLGGRITCPRCQASSKRTKQQCRAPAIKGKQVCRTHGGRSRGPSTEQGRKRCAAAKTIHGWETREKRRVRAEKFRKLKQFRKAINNLC